MKKNLISVVIMALLIVNIVLTSIMMFNVTSTNKKVANLVGNIATVMNLELTAPGEETKEEISLADTEVYAISGAMTMPLTPEVSEDGTTRQSYLVCNIAFSMNKKSKDYSKYGTEEAMAAKVELLKDVINTTVSRHTASELQADTGLENLKAEILKEVQDMYQSDFIYKISISEVRYG